MSCPQIVSSQTHNILHLIVPHVKTNMILHITHNMVLTPEMAFTDQPFSQISSSLFVSLLSLTSPLPAVCSVILLSPSQVQ